MRKTFITSTLSGAIAIVAAIHLTACQSNDIAPDTPVQQNDLVNTTLAISIPQNAAGKNYKGLNSTTKVSSRASQEIVQGADNQFRGLSNIVLIPYSTDSTQRNGANITLEDINKNQLSSGSLAKVYDNILLSVGTAGIRAYAHAKDTTEALEGYHFTNGTLTATGLDDEANTDINTISFTPVSINASSVPSNKAQYLANLLTEIAKTNANGISWSNDENEKTAYYNFIKNAAGSSKTVLGLIQELYDNMKSKSNAMSVALINKINTVTLNDVQDINGGSYPCITNNNGILSLHSDLDNYPTELNLPDGAAVVKWNNNTGFQPVTGSSTISESISTLEIPRYVYMPNLWYQVTSPLKTSSIDQTKVMTTNKDWSEIVNDVDNFPNNSVTTTTKTIAMQQPLRYAVGRMDLTIKLANGNVLYDKAGNVVTPNAKGFEVTGIIIGGQKAVDQDFNPITDSNSKQYSIYDNSMSNMYASSNGSDTNYTLTLPSAAEEVVNIAIELINNTGQNFEGATGIIPNGGKFYLIANLNPPAAKSGYTANELNQVFKQDYITTVKLTIPQNSTEESENHETGLGNAYNVLPDLSKSLISFGFSVDPSWQSGLYFEVEL